MTIEKRALGPTGVDVSRIILGCGNFGGVGSAPEFFGQGESEAEAHELLDAAWERGITTLDTADAYGGGRSESYIGSWLATKPSDVRDQVVVTTKLFHSVDGDPADSGLAPDRIRRCVEASLERLRLDHIPLYMTHQPDPNVPLADTLGALEGEVARGTIGAYGGCNVSVQPPGSTTPETTGTAEPSDDVRQYGWIQNEYNLFARADESDVLPFCEEHGLGYTPFGPLAGGWLAGKYTEAGQYPAGSRMTLRPEPYRALEKEATFESLRRLDELAREHGADSATMALAWLLCNRRVTGVVVGPRRAQHLEPALLALDLELDSDAQITLDALSRHVIMSS